MTVSRLRARGFTLLEIAVALAILGIGVVTVLQTFQGALRLQRRASQENQALLAARRKLDEVFSAPLHGSGCPGRLPLPEGAHCEVRPAKPDDVGLTADEWEAAGFPDADPGDLEDISEEPRLFVVELQMPWSDAGASRTFAIKTFRYYAPQAWSEIGEE